MSGDNLTVADLAVKMEELRLEMAKLSEVVGTQRALAGVTEPIAVSASEVAKMIGINRSQVYQLHHEGALNGFRPHPRAHLKFSVSEVRELVRRMSEARENA